MERSAEKCRWLLRPNFHSTINLVQIFTIRVVSTIPSPIGSFVDPAIARIVVGIFFAHAVIVIR